MVPVMPRKTTPKKKPAAKKLPPKKRPVAKKRTAPKKGAPERDVHVVFDHEENAGLDAEVARRQAAEPATTITRAIVVRCLVKTHLCTPVASKSSTVEMTEPVEDAQGRKMTVRVGSVVQVFRWVPAGVFLRGSPKGEAGRWDDEGPQHEVVLSSGYWFGETPVTQALWEAVMKTNPSQFKGAERPVETVSWHECQEFITRLNVLVPGLDARLPTEAEWEKACRAGTTTATWVGDLDLDRDGVRAPILDTVAVYYGNSGGGGTQPVRSKQPNPLGLYDMLGNVWEWCQDHYGSYEAGSLTDPRGPAEGLYRVIRGGSWLSDARSVRAAYRYVDAPQSRLDDLGFRLARGHQV